MSHSHAERNKCKLAVMFTLNFGFFLVELVVGYMNNCMSLVADSFHMLSDVAALVVAYFAVKMSQKKWSKNTYGWARAEVLGALVNSVFLVALCFSIIIDAIQRFFSPSEIDQPVVVLIVGTIGLLMNLVGLCIFRDSHSHSHGHSHEGERSRTDKRRSTLTHSNRLTRMVTSNVDDPSENNSASSSQCGSSEPLHHHVSNLQNQNEATATIPNPDEVVDEHTESNTVLKFKPASESKGSNNMNIRGVFLHLLADTLGSVIVVVSALIVWLTDWKYKIYVDPTLSLLMVSLILISVYPLLVESSLILLQSVPDHIKIDHIERKLLKQIDGVIGVHELHVWQLTGDRIIATAHIKCTNLQEYFQIAEKVKAVFHNEGIHSTTIQPEFSQQSSENHERECYLSCSAISTVADCSENTCCPKSPRSNNNTKSNNRTPKLPDP